MKKEFIYVKKDITLGGTIALLKGLKELDIIKKYPFLDFNNPDYFEHKTFETKFNVGDRCLYDNQYWWVIDIDHYGYSKDWYYKIAKSKTARSKDMKCVSEKYMMPCDTYWFINSEGAVSDAISGKNPTTDDFRKLTDNYFKTKEDAQARLKEILRKDWTSHENETR